MVHVERESFNDDPTDGRARHECVGEVVGAAESGAQVLEKSDCQDARVGLVSRRVEAGTVRTSGNSSRTPHPTIVGYLFQHVSSPHRNPNRSTSLVLTPNRVGEDAGANSVVLGIGFVGGFGEVESLDRKEDEKVIAKPDLPFR